MVNIICIHGAYPISSAIHLLNRPHKFMGNRVVFKHMDVAGMKSTGVVVIALIVHRNDLRADKISQCISRETDTGQLNGGDQAASPCGSRYVDSLQLLIFSIIEVITYDLALDIAFLDKADFTGEIIEDLTLKGSGRQESR